MAELRQGNMNGWSLVGDDDLRYPLGLDPSLLEWVPFLMCPLDLETLLWSGTHGNLRRGLGPTLAEGKKQAARPLIGAIHGPSGPGPPTASSQPCPLSPPSSIMASVSMSYLLSPHVLRLPNSSYAWD